MSLMESYSDQEKLAVIAFLNMMISSDLEVKIEEINLVWMLAQSIHVDLSHIENLSETLFNQTMMGLSEEKRNEVFRMAYTLIHVDQKFKEKEKRFFLSIQNLVDETYQYHASFYASMNKITDLTPLDQIVLIVLAYYMAEADGIIKQSEIQMLIVLCSMIGVDIHEVYLYKIPKDALYRAVFSMSKHAVKRIVEELIIISIADFKIAEQEYDFIFPIMAHFHLDFEEMVRHAKTRLNEHVEYYELFQTETAIN